MDILNTNHTQIKGLILDMDGVLWHGDRPIGDLPAIFSRIQQLGLQVCLATNNATLTADQFVEKLNTFGVKLSAQQVINSSETTGSYLKSRFPNGGPIYIIGESGLRSTLAKYGFTHAEKHILAVVAGMDRQLTYDQLKKGTLLIRAGSPFIGTNPDRSYPTPEGQVPGAGAILAALASASNVEPLIIGKPKPEMYLLALKRMGVAPEETLVIGDRLETDIIGAQAIGCKTALVLSGVTTEPEARHWQPPVDFIEADLTALITRL